MRSLLTCSLLLWAAGVLCVVLPSSGDTHHHCHIIKLLVHHQLHKLTLMAFSSFVEELQLPENYMKYFQAETHFKHLSCLFIPQFKLLISATQSYINLFYIHC